MTIVGDVALLKDSMFAVSVKPQKGPTSWYGHRPNESPLSDVKRPKGGLVFSRFSGTAF